MTEQIDEMTQPAAGVGQQLRSAREALGRSRKDIAEITKIPERHLVTMEEGRFANLASRAYAIGFTRTYARAVGLNEQDVIAALRSEMGYVDPGAELANVSAYEPGDPVRVPSGRIAMLAASAALVVIVAGIVFWPSPYGDVPDVRFEDPVPAASQQAPAIAQPVVLTALADGVEIEVSDATAGTLFRKKMASGESFSVPATAQAPVLRTMRPDQLELRVGERVLPPLAGRQEAVREYPLVAAALLASGAEPVAAPQAVSSPVPVDASPRGGGQRSAQPQRVVMAPVVTTPSAATAAESDAVNLQPSTVSD